MAVATVTRGEGNMLETKMMLIALTRFCKKADSVQEIYNLLKDMANSEGIPIPSWDEKD